METVEVVIRIPKREIEGIKRYCKRTEIKISSLEDYIYRSIANGTVLPKGHDALLDAGQLMDYCQNQIEGHKYVDCNVIARFPCVVEADKEVSE